MMNTLVYISIFIISIYFLIEIINSFKIRIQKYKKEKREIDLIRLKADFSYFSLMRERLEDVLDNALEKEDYESIPRIKKNITMAESILYETEKDIISYYDKEEKYNKL